MPPWFRKVFLQWIPWALRMSRPGNKITRRSIYLQNKVRTLYFQSTIGHLICTFISENQGFEKLRSFSNLRKISGPAHLIFFFSKPEFFFSLSTGFFSDLYHKPEKNSGDKLKKNSGDKLKKNSGLQELKGLKQTLISQDLHFQKSRYRLNG